MDKTILFERGRQVLPGGVCSSTRLNEGLGHPLYLSRAEGAYLIDVENKPYLDMSCGHGAALLGHGHPAIKKALVTAAELGICCAADMPYHIAHPVCRAYSVYQFRIRGHIACNPSLPGGNRKRQDLAIYRSFSWLSRDDVYRGASAKRRAGPGLTIPRITRHP
ncbi:MAG TPA: aminotransferase class III-fold pyridoxal phosphate-dependent enzyme [candidate division Zixibacteria bacterium]|nr:aminotransferase class III-fold pyridoxal phosphate-dependent enzyme [candidate division Zixibacteria bacterium]